jgi:Fic family protein
MSYQPPYTITPAILASVEQIGEALGRLDTVRRGQVIPRLRRQNRIKTIQASLQIEGNTLSLDQVTAVLDGKRVLAQPREIQEVRNAFKVYETMATLQPESRDDLLAAHRVLMEGLIDQAGRFRTSVVGIFQGEEVAHVAPPVKRVAELMDNLLDWLEATDEHPLIASCVFHYELEFIHPFEDGNGRMGRFWQTLILSHWREFFSLLPIESVVRDRQEQYYRTLGHADQQGDASTFIVFMLDAIRQAIAEISESTDQVGDQVGDQVARLLGALQSDPSHAKSAAELMAVLGLSHRPTFRKNYLRPALDAGLIEMTRPNAPNAKNQKYKLT